MLPAVGYTTLSSAFYPQGTCHFSSFNRMKRFIYLNDCVILGRFLSNRVAVCLVIHQLALSQLYSDSN